MLIGLENIQIEYAVSEDTVLHNGNTCRYVKNTPIALASEDSNFTYKKNNNTGYLNFVLDLDDPNILEPCKIGIVEQKSWALDCAHTCSFQFDISSYYAPDPAAVLASVKTDSGQRLLEIKWLGPNDGLCLVVSQDPSNVLRSQFVVVEKPETIRICVNQTDVSIVSIYNDGSRNTKQAPISTEWRDRKLKFWLGLEPTASPGVVGRVSVKFSSIMISHFQHE